MTLTLSSPAFEHNQPIPNRYTDDGEDISPPLEWSGVPDGSRELALLVEDPDAPKPEPFVHWLIARIRPDSSGLAEAVTYPAGATSPGGSVQGTNSFGSIGYRGPAPPKGHGVHHYHFKLYALNASTDLEEGFDKAAMLSAMQGHVLAETELIGTYER